MQSMQVLVCHYPVQAVLLVKIFTIIRHASAECMPHFMQLTTSIHGYGCQRSSAVFECTVLGGSATVFQGSALSCGASSNEIPLLHSRFNATNGTNGFCNNGAIVAQSVSGENNCYTSSLNVTYISSMLIGRMIECSQDNGITSTIIGTLLIPAEARIKAPLLPTNINWEVDYDDDTVTLLFTWSPSVTNSSSLHYNIFQVNCGSCPTSSMGTNMSCTNLPSDGKVCMFALQVVVCTNVTSNWSDALLIQTGSEHNIVPFSGLLQIAGCLCPGETLIYQCVVPSGTATVWRGSAFNCTSSTIILHHSQYTSGSSGGECNDNSIRGQGLYVANSSYVSILNITVNSDYSNKTIECAYYDGSRLIPVGRSIINTSLSTEPIQSPSDIHVSDITPTHITFSWSTVVSDCRNINYNLHTDNCGICPSATFHTTVSCNNPSIDGRVCHFRAKSVVCGIIAEDFSNLVTVTLKFPEVQDVTVMPQYSRINVNLSDTLTTIMVEILREPEYLPPQFSDHTSFRITYSDSVTSDSSCGGKATIPASSCDNHFCRHILQIPSLTCLSTTDILVTVSATNLLGSGPQLRKIIEGNVTNFVSIIFDPDIASFVCTFLNEQNTTNKFCSIQYGPGDDCDSLSQSTKANSTNNILLISISIQPLVEATYCFSAIASNDTYTVGIRGVVDLACDPVLLGDNTSLPENIACDPPYHSLGISNGIACYSETKSGSIAVYFCLKCGFTTIKGFSTRTCLLNGSWTGSIPQCNCKDDITTHNVVDTNNTCIPNIINIVSTNYSDSNPGNVAKSPFLFGVTITSGALLVSTIIGIIVMIGLIASCVSKRRLQLELQQLKDTMDPIYEDVELNTNANVAYVPNTTKANSETINYELI